MKKNLFLIFFVVFLFGCQTAGVKKAEQAPRPMLVDKLPKAVGDFKYESFYEYPQKALGYSVRYRLQGGGYVDIYIYPVPDQIKALGHQKIVRGMADQAVNEIRYYEKQGVYKNFQILSEKQTEIKGSSVVKVEGTYLKNKQNLYTLLYLTEKSNTLVKARMSVDNNDANKSSQQWDRFISIVFGAILDNMDKA